MAWQQAVRPFGLFVVAAALTLSLAGCRDEPEALKDGSYQARSAGDEDGSYGEVTLKVAGGKITECTYTSHLKDGSLKGADYGKVHGEIRDTRRYEKAQAGIAHLNDYARALVMLQRVSQIDAISGATLAYDQFSDCVWQIYEKADAGAGK